MKERIETRRAKGWGDLKVEAEKGNEKQAYKCLSEKSAQMETLKSGLDGEEVVCGKECRTKRKRKRRVQRISLLEKKAACGWAGSR